MNWDQLLLAEFSLIHYPLQKAVNYVRRVIPNRLYNCEWLLGEQKNQRQLTVTEGLSPSIRLAFCCHLLGNKRLLVFMKVKHLLCCLEFVPKVFGKPNFVIGTPKSHSSPKVWVRCWIMTEMTLVIDRENWWKTPAPFLAGWRYCHTPALPAPSAPLSRGGELNSVMLRRWMKGYWVPWSLVTLQVQWHMALTFSLWVVTPRISSQCTNSLAIGAQRTWSGTVNAKQSAFKEEQGRKPKADSCSVEQYKVGIISCHGIEEVIGAWFRAF